MILFQKEIMSMEKHSKPRRITNCKAILDIRQVEIFTSISLPVVRRKRIEVHGFTMLLEKFFDLSVTYELTSVSYVNS